MPSPDLIGYTDLTLFDRDPQDLVDVALSDAMSKLAEWEPREGNTEVVLIESLALMLAELIFVTNRVPGAVAETLFKLYGVNRDLGAPPTATLEITVADTLGHEIPVGTRVLLELPGGLEPVVFTLTTGLVIAPGSTSGTVGATGDRYTADANGTAAGGTLALIDAVPLVDSITLATGVSDGRDPETDQVWRNRAAQRLSRLIETLALPSHFTAAALEFPAVVRANTVDNYDPATGPTPGSNAGHVTVAVYGDGAALSAPARAEIEAALDAQSLANLAVHVVDPTVTAVAVTATVQRKAGYTDGQVQANVTAALNAYLDPAVWGWSSTVRRNELVVVIDQAEGVDYVTTLAAPASDTTLSGVAPLADLGTVTITTTP